MSFFSQNRPPRGVELINLKFSRVAQSLGGEGLRRPQTDWDMGLGMSSFFCFLFSLTGLI